MFPRGTNKGVLVTCVAADAFTTFGPWASVLIDMMDVVLEVHLYIFILDRCND